MASGGGFELRGVVEDAVVDGAELFDAEVGVGDALAAAAFRAGRRHQRLEDAGDDGGVDAGAIDERGAVGRKSWLLNAVMVRPSVSHPACASREIA